MPLHLDRRANGIWRVRGVHHGVRVNQSAGTRDEREARLVQQAIERQIFDAAILGKKPARLFELAVEDYLISGGEARYILPLLDHFAGRDVATLRQSDLDRAAQKLHPGSAPSTVNRQVHTPFIAVMRLAADNDHCSSRRWRRPSQPEGRTDWRTPQEIDELLALMSPRLGALCTFMVGSFCRASEAIELVHRDLSPTGRRVTFWETKGGYSRSVDLADRALEAVQLARSWRSHGPDDQVWLSDRLSVPYVDHRSVNHTLTRICVRHGIKPLSCHVLRHTGATWRYAMQRDLNSLMRSGGWRSLGMVQRYVHSGTDDLAEQCRARGWSISGQGVGIGV